MDSYIVRIYRRTSQGEGEQIVGTVEDVTRCKTMRFQSFDELEQALTPLPEQMEKKRKSRA